MGDIVDGVGLFDAIYTQRAIRSFTPDPVDRADLVRLVEAATKAPSGGNRQPWAFVVVQDRERLDALARFARNGFAAMYEMALARQQPGDPPPLPRLKRMIESFERIPAMIICCVVLRSDQTAGTAGDYGSIFPAVQNLLLAARGLGLGAALTSGWAMRDMDELRSTFAIPANVEPVAFVPVGHPDDDRYGPTTRRPVDEVLHWDGWEAGKANSAVLPYR